ncbi:MAG: DUF302 domain-containing protein [Gemmatimonadota bacterium]|nr:DUF302 domain-containing protein [Gemmatimonadota bacterium]
MMTTVANDTFHEVTLDSALEEAIATVTDSLATEGFGVLTRIDLHEAFEAKLGIAYRPYAILGACNPALAHSALEQMPEIGLMLPCNVTVEELEGGGSRVRFIDPKAVLGGFGGASDPALDDLAEEAGSRIGRVAAALAETG